MNQEQMLYEYSKRTDELVECMARLEKFETRVKALERLCARVGYNYEIEELEAAGRGEEIKEEQ